MFVRYCLELPLAAHQVEHVLLHAPADWLSTVAGQAQQRGDQLLTKVGVGPLGPRLGPRGRGRGRPGPAGCDVMAVRLSDGSGIEATRDIRATRPRPRC